MIGRDKHRTVVRLEGGVVGHGLDVFVGDSLVLRYDGGFVESMETLRVEIAAARASRAGLLFLSRAAKDLRQAEEPDGHGGKPADRRAAFAAGLEAALLDGHEGRPHPTIEGERLPPEHAGRGGRAHDRGWRLGRAILRAVELAEQGAP